MESNGKFVNLEGTPLPFQTGEIVFGEPGTNGQHSFYQLMHQGRVIPAEFIGVCESQNPVKLEGEAVSSHDELMSNFFAQPDALAMGKTQEECAQEGVPAELQMHKMFPGNRPSMSLLIPDHKPFNLGQLLVLYEHRVAVQGFIWGINSLTNGACSSGKFCEDRPRPVAGIARQEGPRGGFQPECTCLLCLSHWSQSVGRLIGVYTRSFDHITNCLFCGICCTDHGMMAHYWRVRRDGSEFGAPGFFLKEYITRER